MKKFVFVKEYFGARIYDTRTKREYYFKQDVARKLENLLGFDCEFIDNVKQNQFSAPLKISMNLTKKCNLRCKQCFSESGQLRGQELSTKEIFRLFDQMRSNGTFYICLGGGEPFTRNDLMKILDYGKVKQLAISIVSNGLLLTKEKLEELNSKDVDYLWISFEGLKQNHEFLRGLDTFDKTIETLKLMQKYYKGKTAIRMSINKYNLKEWKEMVQIAEQYDVDLIRFTPILSYGRAKDEDLVINQEQYINFLNDIRKFKSEKVKIIYPNMDNEEKFWVGSNGFGCHCGKEAVWIDEEGNYSPCFFWGEQYVLGNIKDFDYMKLWEKSLQVTNFEGNNICKNCTNYQRCRGGCRVRVLQSYENLNGVDPLCPLKKNIEAFNVRCKNI